MSHLSLFLFGPPRLELDSAPVELRRRKALALLAYLATTRQPHSRDALATLLWPERRPRRLPSHPVGVERCPGQHLDPAGARVHGPGRLPERSAAIC